MPPRRWDIRIRDILAAIERIHDYTKGYNYQQFKGDSKTIDAVVRNLEIIGEAACHIPDDITAKNPAIPWREIRDMRNLLAHEYFGVNTKIVWETIQSDFPAIVPALKVLLP
ncbi:conserved uncharacterized protein, DUF86 [Desulfosarcina variabilis str. Montpellier]|uniref:HepT-like ribonuclease domain-containing protein n=1 Tax=Desulfosarcina variabilis TaxID=2300 RepID=UPI003AFB1C55